MMLKKKYLSKLNIFYNQPENKFAIFISQKQRQSQ